LKGQWKPWLLLTGVLGTREFDVTGETGMEKIRIDIGIAICTIIVIGIIASCGEQKEQIPKKPLTTDEIRANFVKNVENEMKNAPVKIDFRIEGNTLYMIDKSETATGLNIIEKALKGNGVWVEDPNNTLGHFGSSLMKLGFTHFVSWGSKDKKIHSYELKYKQYKQRGGA
jgi:hypothetical protein